MNAPRFLNSLSPKDLRARTWRQTGGGGRLVLGPRCYPPEHRLEPRPRTCAPRQRVRDTAARPFDKARPGLTKEHRSSITPKPASPTSPLQAGCTSGRGARRHGPLLRAPRQQRLCPSGSGRCPRPMSRPGGPNVMMKRQAAAPPLAVRSAAFVELFRLVQYHNAREHIRRLV
jgi:hypothetical protein